jgi:hypothetical protein
MQSSPLHCSPGKYVKDIIFSTSHCTVGDIAGKNLSPVAFAFFLRRGGFIRGFYPVFRIRIRILIHRIHIFLGPTDPDPLVRGVDPDPSIILLLSGKTLP